jgi:hypothetical protein
MRRFIALVLVTAFLGFGPADQAEAKTFKNCTELRKQYANGVSLRASAVNRGSGPILRPRTLPAIYNLNKRLDVDKDGIACEVLRAKPSPSPSESAASEKTPPPIEVSKSPRVLFYERLLQQWRQSSSNKEYNLNFKLCPNVNETKAKETTAAYSSAMKFWSGFFVSSSAVEWVLMSEKDYACWREKVMELEGPQGDFAVWNNQTGILGHCQVASSAFCGYGSGVVRSGAVVQYNMIGSAYNQSPQPSVVHHEAVHIYQASLKATYRSTTRENTLPPWFVEGQANLIGWPIAQNGNYDFHRNFEMDRLKAVIPGAGSYTTEQWLAELLALENRHEFVFKNELGYSLGWFALEPLYFNYSLEKMHELLETINKGQTWDQALQSVLGVTKADLYRQISEHLANEVN